MSTVFIVLFSVICLSVMPFYLTEQRRRISFRSLLLKMVCASMFLLVGVLALRRSGGSPYARAMLVGLALSWVGDLFLHIHGLHQAIGVLGFLGAHFAYLAAYQSALRAYDPNTRLLTPGLLVPIAVGMLLYLLVFIFTRTSFSVLMVPLAGYIFVLMLMCVKAIQLAHFAAAQSPAGAVCLSVGSLLFLLSDTSLGLLMFNKKLKPNFPLKIFNIATYFAAQLLLAYTILLF